MFQDFKLPVSRTVVIIGSVFHCIQASYVQKTLKARDMMQMISHSNLNDMEQNEHICQCQNNAYNWIQLDIMRLYRFSIPFKSPNPRIKYVWKSMRQRTCIFGIVMHSFRDRIPIILRFLEKINFRKNLNLLSFFSSTALHVFITRFHVQNQNYTNDANNQH